MEVWKTEVGSGRDVEQRKSEIAPIFGNCLNYLINHAMNHCDHGNHQYLKSLSFLKVSMRIIVTDKMLD